MKDQLAITQNNKDLWKDVNIKITSKPEKAKISIFEATNKQQIFK